MAYFLHPERLNGILRWFVVILHCQITGGGVLSKRELVFSEKVLSGGG